MNSIDRVYNYQTGQKLEGYPSEEVCKESAKTGEGAVRARLVDGEWVLCSKNEVGRVTVYTDGPLTRYYIRSRFMESDK